MLKIYTKRMKEVHPTCWVFLDKAKCKCLNKNLSVGIRVAFEILERFDIIRIIIIMIC